MLFDGYMQPHTAHSTDFEKKPRQLWRGSSRRDSGGPPPAVCSWCPHRNRGQFTRRQPDRNDTAAHTEQLAIVGSSWRPTTSVSRTGEP